MACSLLDPDRIESTFNGGPIWLNHSTGVIRRILTQSLFFIIGTSSRSQLCPDPTKNSPNVRLQRLVCYAESDSVNNSYQTSGEVHWKDKIKSLEESTSREDSRNGPWRTARRKLGSWNRIREKLGARYTDGGMAKGGGRLEIYRTADKTPRRFLLPPPSYP